MSSITINKFTGMSNMNSVTDSGVSTPERIVNAVPSLDGSINKRKGSSLIIPTVGHPCSNLWKSKGTGTVYLVVGYELHIVDIELKTTSFLANITHESEKVYFVSNGNVDFIGNDYWMIAVENGVVRSVGQSLADLADLNWEETENGTVLFYKNSSGKTTVVPHPAEFAHVPNPVDLLCLGHGRLWGASGNFVRYSYPILIEWWEDQNNFFEFSSEVTMIAPVRNGVFFGTKEKTAFLSGTDPETASMTVMQWEGVKKHSLVFANKLKGIPNDSPVWMSNDGSVSFGTPDGQIFDITREVVNVTPPDRCRSGIIKLNGVDTLLFKIEE